MFYVFLSILLFVLIGVGAISSTMPEKANHSAMKSAKSDEKELKDKMPEKGGNPEEDAATKSNNDFIWDLISRGY